MASRRRSLAALFLSAPLFLATLPPALAADGADQQTPLATVDGREVRAADLDRAYDAFGKALEEMPVVGEGDPRLERYINFRLIAEAARDAGLGEDPEVRRTIEQMTDLVLFQTFLFHFVNEVAGEAVLRERYDLKYDEGSGLRQVHARLIEVKDREVAEKVIEALDGGADFAELAEEHSVAPSASEGGDIGFVGPGDVPPPFIDAAFSLEPGEFTPDPVETASGWQVIKVEARRSAKAPSFEEALPELRREAVDNALTALLAKLRAQEGIEPNGGEGQK